MEKSGPQGLEVTNGDGQPASPNDIDSFNPASVAQHYSTHVGQPNSGRDEIVEFDFARHFRSTSPARSAKSPSNNAQSFFPENDRFEVVDQSVNFMDHNKGDYTQPAEKKADTRFSNRTSFLDIFMGSNRGSITPASNLNRAASGTIDDHEEGKRLWPRIMSYGLLFLCFGVAAAFLALSVPHLARDVISEEEMKLRFNAIRVSLIAANLAQAQDFQNQSSNQFYALQWLSMADVAMLAHDDPRLPSRYALAVFFYNNHPEIAEKHSRGERKLSSGWRHQDNWMATTDVCTWFGLECETRDAKQKVIVHWNMTDNMLRGSLPSEIKAMSNLVSIDLSSNRVTGAIPETIYTLNNLKYLNLRDNSLTGSISEEIGYFYSAEEIDFSKNELKGYIPKTIGTTVNLRHLSLSENDLQGTIPDMARLTHLESINLDLNKLVGTFPISLTTLTSLTRISMEGNLFSGSLPSGLDALTSLEILSLGHNRFNGAIPDVFEGLNNLTEIRLQKNLFQHGLPPSMGGSQNLKRIMLDGNRLVGSIPSEWMALKKLEALIIHKNELTGSIMSEFGNLVQLQDLWLNNNEMTGEIPSFVGLLASLNTLYLQQNSLVGTIPTELGLLEGLQALRLANNDISGVVPEEVCSLKEKGELSFVSSSCHQLRCLCCDKCA